LAWRADADADADAINRRIAELNKHNRSGAAVCKEMAATYLLGSCNI
jgi:hypothetical protein